MRGSRGVPPVLSAAAVGGVAEAARPLPRLGRVPGGSPAIIHLGPAPAVPRGEGGSEGRSRRTTGLRGGEGAREGGGLGQGPVAPLLALAEAPPPPPGPGRSLPAAASGPWVRGSLGCGAPLGAVSQPEDFGLAPWS